MVRTEYDGGGRVVGQTDALGNTTQYVYDKLGRKIEQILPDPDGSGPLTAAATLYGYDPQGNLAYVTDALGTSIGTGADDPNHSTDYTYDAAGRKLTETDACPGVGQTRPVTTYASDPDGNLVYVTDPRGNTTQYVYDDLGRKTAVIPPPPNPTQYITVQATNPTNSSATWSVSGLPSGTSGSFYEVLVSWSANAANTDMASYTVYDGTTGSTKQWTVDTINQQLAPLASPLYSGGWQSLGCFWISGNTLSVQLINKDGGTLVAGSIRIVQVNPSVVAYDSNGNVTATTNALGFVTDSVYDNLNRKIETIQPDAATGQTAQSDANCPKTYVAYDSAGNVASTTDPNGNVTRYTYNIDNRQTQIIDALGNTTTTTFDAVGNAIFVTDALGRTAAYAFDSMNRRIRETLPLADGTTNLVPQMTWQYDLNGNVTAVTDARGFTTWTQYNGWNLPTQATDALGAYAGDPQHTTTTAYDQLGRVLTVTDTLGRVTTYQYDNLGRKTAVFQPDPSTGQKTSNSPTTYYGYDADGNLFYTTDPLNTLGAGDPAHRLGTSTTRSVGGHAWSMPWPIRPTPPTCLPPRSLRTA